MRTTLIVPEQIGSKEHLQAALLPYRHLNPFPRHFARFKILMDPMFPRLADFVRPGWKMIDVGCGYGVPAAWLLAIYPDLKFLACEPNGERARVTSRVLADRGRVVQCSAMDLPLENEKADAVLCLDMLHYLSDQELGEFLVRIRSVLSLEGKLIIRVTIPKPGFHFFRSVEWMKLRVKGIPYYFRGTGELSRIMEQKGFHLDLVELSAPKREEIWFILSASFGD
jgi:uncharacterized protein